MLRRFRRDEGQELVEFALLALPLFLILFGIMEFGVAVWRYNTISNAAREGARAAIVLRPADLEAPLVQDEIAGVARDYAASMGVHGVEATVEEGTYDITDPDDPSMTNSLPTVVVSVSYTHQSVTGLISPIDMRASSTMLLE